MAFQENPQSKRPADGPECSQPAHTAASLFIASGTDVGTVAGLLGHSQPSTTLDIYTHAFDKNKKAASQIMQSSLEI